MNSFQVPLDSIDVGPGVGYLDGSLWKSELIALQCEFGHFWRWKLLDLVNGLQPPAPPVDEHRVF
jgi:hypothetical protein